MDDLFKAILELILNAIGFIISATIVLTLMGIIWVGGGFCFQLSNNELLLSDKSFSER